MFVDASESGSLAEHHPGMERAAILRHIVFSNRASASSCSCIRDGNSCASLLPCPNREWYVDVVGAAQRAQPAITLPHLVKTASLCCPQGLDVLHGQDDIAVLDTNCGLHHARGSGACVSEVYAQSCACFGLNVSQKSRCFGSIVDNIRACCRLPSQVVMQSDSTRHPHRIAAPAYSGFPNRFVIGLIQVPNREICLQGVQSHNCVAVFETHTNVDRADIV